MVFLIHTQHLCIQIYHQQIGLCLMARDILLLNLRTILLCTLTTKTVFLQTAKNSSHQPQEMQTTCQAQTPSVVRSQKASSMTSSRISNFQKNKAELLASSLQQWNLLNHSVKVTTFSTRNQEFEQFFKIASYFTYCKDIDGLMDAMHMRHSPEQWRLFIGASKRSLKEVLLHNGNKLPSIPVARNVFNYEQHPGSGRLQEVPVGSLW